LVKLQDVIRQRLADAPEGSYTAKLASQGMLKVAQKLGEEGVELALAAAATKRPDASNPPPSQPASAPPSKRVKTMSFGRRRDVNICSPSAGR
jgi:hypothetical protein